MADCGFSSRDPALDSCGLWSATIFSFVGIGVRWLVRAVLWALTLSTVLLCLVIVRLVIAPVDLDFIRPEIESQLQQRLPDWQIEFDAVTLGWNWHAVGPFLQVEAISGRGFGGTFNGTTPSAEVVISAAVLWGEVEVQSLRIGNTRLDVDNPKALIASEPRAEVTQQAGSDQQASIIEGPFRAQALAPVAQLVTRIADRIKTSFPKLEAIEVASLDALLRNDREKQVTRITLPRLGIYQADGTIAIDAQADVDIGGRPMRLQVEAYALPHKVRAKPVLEAYATLDPAAQAAQVQLNVSVSDIRPDDISQRVKLPEIVGAITSPVQLALELEINTLTGLDMARYNISIGAGSMSHPMLYPKPAPIKFGRISGSYDAELEGFILSDVTIDLGTTMVKADGQVFWEDDADSPSGKLHARMENATVADVVTYWPVTRYPDGRPKSARDWIDRNMIRGDISNVNFHLQWDKDGNGPFRQGSIYDLGFDFEKIDSYLIDTMPPVRNAYGSASLIESALTMTIEGGDMEGVEVRRSRMLLDGLDVKNTDTGYFHVHLAGDLKDILPIVDHRPVRLSRRLGPSFDRFRGQAEVWADVVLPLSGWVGADDVSFEVEAELKSFEFDDFLDGPGIRDGDLVLNLDPEGIKLEGRAAINGTEVDFKGYEDMALAARDANAKTFSADITGQWQVPELKAFKADITKWAQGPLSGDVAIRGRSFQPTHGDFKLNVTRTTITLDELGWAKPSDIDATVTGSIDFLDKGVRIDGLHLLGDQIDATMNLAINTLSDDSLALDAVVDQLGENTLQVDVMRIGDQPYMIDITAESLDIRPFIGPVEDEAQRAALEARDGALLEAETIIKSEDDELPRGSNVPDLVLNAKAQSVVLLNGEKLRDADFTFSFEEGEPVRGMMRAQIARSTEAVVLDLIPGDDKRTLNLNTMDGGGILRGLGFFAHAEGGSFRVNGTTYGWGDGLRMDIVSKLRDSRIYGLTEIQERTGNTIDAGGISGIDDYIDKGGIAVSKADVPMFYHGGLVDFSDMVANGPSIGITLEGQLHTKLNKINVNGLVVPAYGVNSLLGKIPLIGPIFSGGEGGGLFAVPYRVKGDMSDPDVDVSAGSAAIPGILRGLFTGSKGTIEDMQREESRAAEKKARKEAKEKAKQAKQDRRRP